MTLQNKYDLMAAIYSLNRLICYKEWRKYQMCRVVFSFNYLIVLNQKMMILLEFFFYKNFFLIWTITLNY